MATETRNVGPKVGQIIEYNNSGTVVPALISAIAFPAGTVSGCYFTSSGATGFSGANYDPNLTNSGSWRWPDIL